jgi:shikimate dehydrogenase
MPRLGVIGWPVAHSRSPAMFEAAFRAYSMQGEWSYQRLPIPPPLLRETVRALGGAGFVGANVTIPHKRAALALSDSASPTARAIGAANTLSFDADGAIVAENTDAPGLIAALGQPVEGVHALVLGAGGSSRAAVWALLDAGAQVSVWNRTPERARELARQLGARAVERPVRADLLVNCTSVGLERERGRPSPTGVRMSGYPSEPASPPGSNSQPESSGASSSERTETALNQLQLDADLLGEYSNVVDLVYSNGDTPLIAAARRAGTRTVGGLEVLVAQGALSFELWTGREAPCEAMRRGAGID